MEEFPEAGTDAAVHATFRLVFVDSKPSNPASSSQKGDAFVGRKVAIEPLDYPGMVVVAQEKGGSLAIAKAGGDDGPSVFRLAEGLDGKDGTVSLESESHHGCFVMHNGPGRKVMLSCSASAKYKQAASFVLRDGISSYHPLSFVAEGTRRNFLLFPLLSLRDESYTVYFNIQA